MSDVFFIPFDSTAGKTGLSQAAARLLGTLLDRSGIPLPGDVPLKVFLYRLAGKVLKDV